MGSDFFLVGETSWSRCLPYGGWPVTVARGPVPRDLRYCIETGRSLLRGMAAGSRSARACPSRSPILHRDQEVSPTGGWPVPVARGPVPREFRYCVEIRRSLLRGMTSGSRSARACPSRSPSLRCCLRSFRTYMSIEKRAGPTSRSFRSLIKNTRRRAKHIKDLKDLRILRVCACYRHSGPTDLKRRFFLGGTSLSRYEKSRPGGLSYRGLAGSRSARACPSRSPSSRDGVLGPLGPTCL